MVTRLQLRSGRVTRTGLPNLLSTGPVSFVAGPKQVIVRPLDDVPGYLVPDDQPARSLPEILDRGGQVLPGPVPGQVWVEVYAGNASSMLLVDLSGQPTERSVILPSGIGAVQPDGAGYLLVTDLGGTYEARPRGLQRVTTGAVIAAGPSRYLIADCDRHHHCTSGVINRATGKVRGLATRRYAANTVGTVSPDGRTAALVRAVNNTRSLHFLDLRSGHDRVVARAVESGVGDDGTLVWSPDSRWLFTIAGGQPRAIEARTGRAVGLDVRLSKVEQLALRPVSLGTERS
jgi:hypothetical protein